MQFLKNIKLLNIFALIIILITVIISCDNYYNTEDTFSNNTSTSIEISNESSYIAETYVSIDDSNEINSDVSTPQINETSSITSTNSDPEKTHTHNFSEATCTVPKTCLCGATEGKANGHSWIDATCLSPKICSICNFTEGSVLEHNWTDATCKTPKTCTLCDKTVGSILEHNWKDATYSTPKTCTICGAVEGEPLEKPGNENYHGHVYTGGSSSKKYHYEAECPGKNSHEITWEEVERRNLGPCGTCVMK